MSECTTFYRMLKDNVDRWGDKEAILYDTISVTYKGLFEDVIKKAIHLKRFEGREIAIIPAFSPTQTHSPYIPPHILNCAASEMPTPYYAMCPP